MSEEEKGINASELDPNIRTGQQKENLMKAFITALTIKSQDAKIKFLKEITKEHDDEAIVGLDNKLTPKEKVRNRAAWIQERRKIADFYKINRRTLKS